MHKPSPCRWHSSIEPLEARIAPAVILMFTDVDGDQVKLVSNKALTAAVSFAANGNPSEITITGAGLDGANLSTVVTRGADGDGFVNIGRIVASGLDLGVVNVKGDLGKIDCGNSGNALPAIKSLTARSMGIFGLATQGGGSLSSTITGDVGAITIRGDVVGARLEVSGDVGTVRIGGDLQGTNANFSGRLEASSFGSITIGGDLRAALGDESGKIRSGGTLGSLTIRGSVYGAIDGVPDPGTGQILVQGKAGPITIGRDLFGGTSEQKALDLRGGAGPISIGGSIFGGPGLNSGAIVVVGDAGLVKVRHDVNGGGGSASSQIKVSGDVAGITIGGELRGGAGAYSASIDVGGKSTGPIRIGRDLAGGTGDFSASLFVDGTVAGLNIGGDVRGSSANYQDGVSIVQVKVAGSTGPVRIGGEIVGGSGRGGGNVLLGTGAPSFFLGGSVIGGGTELPGVIAFPSGSVSLGSVSTVTIGGDIRESGFTGGSVLMGAVGKLTIRGSVSAAPDYADTVSGGTPLLVTSLGSGRIGGSIVGSPEGVHETVRIGSVAKTFEIVGTLEGSSGGRSGTLLVTTDAASIKIGGSLRAGTGFDSGAVLANGRIGSLRVAGGIEGNTSIGFASAQVNAMSFGKVTIGGDLVGNAAGSGSIRAVTGGFDAITIGGSLYAGTAGGSLVAAAGLGVVKIGGSISGGFGMNHSSLLGASAKSITIGRDVFANGNGGNVLIDIRDSTGPITIGGDVRGSTNESARLLFAMASGVTEAGFASLKIKGSVSNALIAAGLRRDLVGQNGDATLGPVSVGGDWTASTLSAGVVFGTDNAITNATPNLSRIAAITIKGQVAGSATAGDAFRFIAQRIGPVKIGGVSYTASTSPIQLDSLFDDVTLRLA